MESESESSLARILMKQYLSSLDNEENSHSSSDDILVRFKAMGEKLKANSRTALTHPESISMLCDLNNALADWQILKKKNKSVKRIFTRHDLTANMNERLAILAKLNKAEKLDLESSQRDLESSRRDLWDRYTFYKPHPFTCIGDEVPFSDEPKKWMVDWLTSDSDFKAVGIYGPGGSGKTAPVKSVLKQEGVGDKFKRIIWACLSQLNCTEEIDDWIIKYLLYRLGLDTDSLVGNLDENKDWLMEEIGRRLQNSGNYILVLDDMWHYSEWFADDLLGKLKKNGGSEVIVTSRKKTVAKKISKKKRLIHLNLSADKYLFER